MIIDEKYKKIKSYFLKNEKDFFIVSIIIIISLISFGLGRLYQIEISREPLMIEWYDLDENQSNNLPVFLKENETKGESGSISNIGNQISDNEAKLVASKNGGRYHYPWCPSAKTIKPENLVTFNSIQEARAAGYTPAANCPGLE